MSVDYDQGAQARVAVSLTVNGTLREASVPVQATLLDLLRERFELTGAKKGCDRGQCGACTVLIDGRRSLSCLTLAVSASGHAVRTIEGLELDGVMHPVQAAFVKHDALQCGFCTPGQIMSALGAINEGRATSDDAIREAMSGNICRCGAYPNIVDAVREAAAELGARS